MNKRRSKLQSLPHEPKVSSSNSTALGSKQAVTKFVGKKPETPPPRTIDFEELEKKMIDVLVDSIKYIATTCGITIAIYSQILQGYIKSQSISPSSFSHLFIFFPLLLWFMAIVGTVIGIYPRHYKATTDLEKQNAIDSIRQTKRFWLKSVLFLFLCGFAVFLYIVGAQLWQLFPFMRGFSVGAKYLV
jgi:hypothetical protein